MSSTSPGMKPIDKVMEQARKNPQRIVLAEGEDERVIRAAAICRDDNIALPVLLGCDERIKKQSVSLGVALDGVEIIDPDSAPRMTSYTSLYIESRKGKHITQRMAERLIKRPMFLGAVMVRAGDAAGMVAGCASATATVVEAGELMVGLKEGVSAPSSFFVMSVPDCPYGEDGSFIFADAGVNPDPSPRELAEIAVLSSESARDLLEWEPRVAMLSFSTRGSASHRFVDKVVEATKIAKEIAPGLAIDGEFQLDAAIVPAVAEAKVKDTRDVAGKANILIFPDLNAGNIAYKLTQYLAKAEAYGPLLQGFAMPVSDLSRGASVQDIVGVVAFTTVEAQSRNSSRKLKTQNQEAKE